LFEDRVDTKNMIAAWRIPHSTVAELASVSRSEVSLYVKNQTVSTRDRARIEQTVREIAEFVWMFQSELGVRPDLSDISNLRRNLEIAREVRAEHKIKHDTVGAAQ